MKNNKKKGFTLVELLVVIAIIAVLATVSVVGYTVFINSADESADEQLDAQLDKVLFAAEADKNADVAKFDPNNYSAAEGAAELTEADKIAEAKKAVLAYIKTVANMDAADLVANQDGMAFYYNVETNSVEIKSATTADSLASFKLN